MVRELSADPSRPAASSRLERALWLLLMLLLVPGLLVGPVFDDWFHAYDAQAATGWWQRLFGLYDFFHADEVPLAREHGLLPWWSDDRLSIAFFRPLSSLLLGVDHLLLDGGGLLSHLHAVLWYVLAVLVARRVLSLLFGPEEARWGTLLYALSSVHVVPLAFVAALYAHVTAVFALFSFECLIRAVPPDGAQPGPGRWQLGSALLFLVALAGGESAVVILPIACAYLWAESGLRRALLLLAPHLLAAALFVGLYFALDYGSHHSWGYLQPGSVEFFRALLPRWLVLCAGLLSGFPPDLWIFGAQPLQLVFGVVALLLAALALRGVLASPQPALGAAASRRLVALSLGALVALLPLTSGIPGGRLLMLPNVVAAALFGMAARRAAYAWRDGRKPRALWLGAWALAFGVGLHPLFRALVPLDMARIGKELPAAARDVAERCRGATALGVGVPDNNDAYLPWLFLQLPEAERPGVFHLLSMAPGRHRLSQTASDRFELEVEGDFLALPWARIYRDSPVPAALRRSVRGVDVEVLEAQPSATRLALRLGGAAPACWLTLQKGELVPIQPAPGKLLEWTPTLRAR